MARSTPSTPATSAQPVLINVTVPPDAEIWFDGAPTTQKGSVRQFVSPPISAGQNYSYQLNVRWLSGGRQVDETRRLSVRAGDRVSINFTGPSDAATIRYAPDPGTTETQSFYFAPGQAPSSVTGTPADPVPVYTAPPYYYDNSPSYSAPSGGRTRFYNEDDYPRPGGPPGGWGHGVGEG
jgi:uncharacterized protein (TIGR03000 family)